MILSGEFRAREVAEIKRFNSIRLQIGVFERFFAGSNRQGAEILVRERSEPGFTRANYRNLSHRELRPSVALKVAHKSLSNSPIIEDSA